MMFPILASPQLTTVSSPLANVIQASQKPVQLLDAVCYPEQPTGNTLSDCEMSFQGRFP